MRHLSLFSIKKVTKSLSVQAKKQKQNQKGIVLQGHFKELMKIVYCLNFIMSVFFVISHAK